MNDNLLYRRRRHACIAATAAFVFINSPRPRRWWQRQLLQRRYEYSGEDLRTDLRAGCLPEEEALPGRLFAVPYVIVADDAFALHKHITKPFPGHQEREAKKGYSTIACLELADVLKMPLGFSVQSLEY
ncbi:hypothetical protein J6590_094068 [Homalodisca vitripennis]|nr:hypothetical protein J6590_094068 [Homalodisca vitripennis]